MFDFMNMAPGARPIKVGKVTSAKGELRTLAVHVGDESRATTWRVLAQLKNHLDQGKFKPHLTVKSEKNSAGKKTWNLVFQAKTPVGSDYLQMLHSAIIATRR